MNTSDPEQQIRRLEGTLGLLALDNMALRSALQACVAHLRVLGEIKEYGHFPGGDPRSFQPECCTPAELAAHAAACAAAGAGAPGSVSLPPGTSELYVKFHSLLGRKDRVSPDNAPMFGAGFFCKHPTIASIVATAQEALDASILDAASPAAEAGDALAAPDNSPLTSDPNLQPRA